MAISVVKPIEPGSLSGFTLFEGNKGWQLSYRARGETGWSVHIVDEAVARRFLDVLTEDVAGIYYFLKDGLPVLIPSLSIVEPNAGNKLAAWLIAEEDRLNTNLKAREG